MVAKKKGKKILSVLMAIFLLIGCIPTDGFVSQIYAGNMQEQELLGKGETPQIVQGPQAAEKPQYKEEYQVCSSEITLSDDKTSATAQIGYIVEGKAVVKVLLFDDKNLDSSEVLGMGTLEVQKSANLNETDHCTVEVHPTGDRTTLPEYFRMKVLVEPESENTERVEFENIFFHRGN